MAIAIEEYSENIILYYQNREVEIEANNISKIIEEPEKYFIYVETGTAEKHRFVKKMLNVYNCIATDNYRNNVKILVTAMRRWALSLPRIAREVSKTLLWITKDRNKNGERK